MKRNCITVSQNLAAHQNGGGVGIGNMQDKDIGQCLSALQSTGNVCLTTILVPSLMDTSVERQTHALVSLEKESELFGDTYGAGTVDVITNNAESIVGHGNGATSTEGVELNKTPAPKSKRKKHRPKVLREEKPSKTPKSTTPKPSKGKEEKPSGKRKYVRKKTQAGKVAPELAAGSNCRREPEPVRRCLNFDGQFNEDGVHAVTQTLVTDMASDPKDHHPSVSSINQRNDQSQCSYQSQDQLTNAHFLPADIMQNRVSIDLNSCTNQLQNDYTIFPNCPAQDFQSGIRNTLDINPSLEHHAGMPCANVPDLNCPISLQQNLSTRFAEYLISSPHASLRQAQMANQMLNGHGMPENRITINQSAGGTVIADRVLNSYTLRNNHNSPANTEGNSVIQNITMDDYSSINANPYKYTRAAIRSHDSHYSSHGANFFHQNNEFVSASDCSATTSRTSFFPGTYKRMRTDNYDYYHNVVFYNSPTSPAFLSHNQNANLVSTTNSNLLNLDDSQRLLACEKYRASQRMFSFGLAQNGAVKRSEMVEQYNRSVLPGTACKEVTDNKFRQTMQELTHLSYCPNTLHSENAVARLGSHQIQTFGGHNVSPQDGFQNTVCVIPVEDGRSISGDKSRSSVTRTNPGINSCTVTVGGYQLDTSIEVTGAPEKPTNSSASNDVLRTDNNLLEVSPETLAVKPSKKQKVRGRPRKELKPGEKPRPRGRPRKERVVHPVPVSKVIHTDPLQHVDISCARTVNTEGVIESVSEATVPSADSLDSIIQKIMLLDINKSDDICAAEPHGALVPCKGNFGAIIPFEGNIKRKHSRAKVDLDPVTTLMWKLLMGPDMSDGTKMDKDKEKWLDEEREVFRGRVDSFIARMHLVQGDRRFSPWKGSVVDSVVGVFLTQNVSDHLSSSAFMALAAKFPVNPEASEKRAAGVFHMTSEENGCCSSFFGDAVKPQGEIHVEGATNMADSLITTEETEGSNSIKLFGRSVGNGLDYAGVYSDSHRKVPIGLHESGPVVHGTGSFAQVGDGPLENVVSSQDSAISSHSSPHYLFHRKELMPSTLLNFIAEDFTQRNMPNDTGISTSYTELLRMQETKSKYGKVVSSEYHEVLDPLNQGLLLNKSHNLRQGHQPLHTLVNYHQNGREHLQDIAYGSNSARSLYTALNTVDYFETTQAETSCHYPSSANGIAGPSKSTIDDSLSSLLHDMDGSLSQDKGPFPSEPMPGPDLISGIIGKYLQPSVSEMISFAKESCQENLSRNEAEVTFVKQNANSMLREKNNSSSNQMGHESLLSGCSQHFDNAQTPAVEVQNGHSSNICKNNKSNSEIPERVDSGLVDTSKDAKKPSTEVPTDGPKAKKARGGTGKKRTYDWDGLRKEVLCSHGNKERGHTAKDSVDWDAIRRANVKEISETIRERGMNNMLAERIKDFLDRLVRDHGSIDLEWLRYVEPDKAKDYLLSIRGLGLKSVECVRLLTLHHMAFPVDTNVGRICVRLGWVPLQPLPESLQLHLLELYPMLENIQKYLWPRLCKLDQQTLYELHYQMITFGKVFCTKSKPNCNACPMRAECKHFASAFASARLALPGPEEKSLVASSAPMAADGINNKYINFGSVSQEESWNKTYIGSGPVSQLEWNSQAHGHILENGDPIIEEPMSPEQEPVTEEIKEDAIEDAFIDDPEEIPTIKLNFMEFTQNLKNYMQANNIEIEDADMSKALVAVTPELASIPTPKLKNVSRLRTEHQVYVLPDSHPLLEGLEQREADDPCPYLLSIWTPGETAQSTDAPKTFCNSHENGKLCESATCFSCNSIREAEAQKVRGTILIPCRTAMRGSFPLNGTYFQVNEVFADHETSRNPIDVQRSWIWNLPRRTVYFGTSVPTIFKGLSTEDIQHCFWRGFVCVRGFDRKSRAPRPLYARLHFPASKITRNKRSAASTAAGDDK